MARTKQTARRSVHNYHAFPKKAIKRYNSSDDEDEDDYNNNSDYDGNQMEIENDQGTEAIEENKEDTQPNPPASGDYLGPPRKPLNAFYFFKVDEFDATRAAHPTLTMMEVIDVIGQKWGDLDDDKKAEYQEKYEKHNNLYEESLKPRVWKPPVLPKKEPLVSSSTTTVVNPLLNTSDSKPDPPKRPLSAFFLFKEANFMQVKKDNPDAKITDIIKIIDKMWMDADQETKAAYEAKNMEAKQKYEQDLKEYEEKYGSIQKKKRRAKQASDASEEEEEQQHSEEEEKERVKPIKSRDVPAPPKKPLSAFFLFKEANFMQVKKDNPDAKVTEITRIICQMWNNVDRETKAAYEAKNMEAKQKYEQDLKEYEEKYESIQKKKRRAKPASDAPEEEEEEQQHSEEEENERVKLTKAKDIPAPPKRPLAAFFLFKEDKFQQVKKENPDAKITDITKIIAKMWMNVDQETKAAYDAKNMEAKQKYEQDMKEYEEKYGSIQKKKRRAKPASDASEEEQSEEEKERAKPGKASLKKGKKA